MWAGGFFPLENGRDRTDHGGANRENEHFQGVGEYEVNQPHDLRPENPSPGVLAALFAYRHVGRKTRGVSDLIFWQKPHVVLPSMS
jgi:hypothetical protein